MAGRTLDWASLRNARDLGGVALRDGTETRYGSVVRTETTRELTAAGWSAARTFGVATILDLREPDEIRLNQQLYGGSVLPGDRVDGEPDAPLPEDGLPRANVALLAWTRELGDHLDRVSMAEADAVGSTRAVYLEILRLCRPRFADAFRAVADAPPGAILVHCHAGKDRTGLVCALLLELAGAAPEDIADDYAVSGTVFEPYVETWLEGIDDEHDRELRRRVAQAPRQALLDVLGELETGYGGAEAYLRGGGLDDGSLARARARLVP